MGPRKKKVAPKKALEKEEISDKTGNDVEKILEEPEVVEPSSSSSKSAPQSLPADTTTAISEVPTIQDEAELPNEKDPQLDIDFDEDEEDFKPQIAMGSAHDLKSRLFQLRMKINQGRKANQQEVEEEFQRVTFNRRRDKVKEGNDEEQRSLLDQTAAEAEWEAMKAEKKKETAATYGLNAFTSDAYYRAYEKRVSKLQHDKRVEASKQEEDEDLDYDPLSYGKTNAAVSADALDRLQKDVLDREEQRKKYSRKRPELGDVDYINEKNQNFNKKLKRAFDKYTVEIRQNLERGTAI
ncbi:hypothetical protein EON65_13090 [archaeon]|nr:MAG: hypothetical protein EON65_13090 [archaeon]